MNNFKFKIYFVLIAGVLVLAALVFWAVLPLVGKISQSYSDISKSQSDFVSLNKNYEAIKKAGDQLDGNKKNLDNIRKNFLKLGDSVGFQKYLDYLEKSVSETGNVLSNDVAIESQVNPVKNQPGKSKPGFYQLKVSISGNYPGLLKLINVFENGNYYTEIVSIRADRAELKNSGAQAASLPGVSLNNGSNNLKSYLIIKIFTFDFQV